MIARPVKPASAAPAREKGAALITVLFLVAVMAALSITLVDRVRYDILRATGRAQSDQARWFAISAEAMAQKGLADSIRLSPGRTTLRDPWATQSGRFPIPGGFIDGRITDGGNCFNVNMLVSEDENLGLVANPDMAPYFEALIMAAGIDEVTTSELRARVVDWIDSDSRAEDSGAEDFDYLPLKPGYRTANTPLHDLTELRALKGMSNGLLDVISPFLCALPTTETSPINVNTLTPQQAPLLVMLTAGQMPLDEAQLLIETAPATGYASKEAFVSLPQFAEFPLSNKAQELIAVRTRFFTLNTVVALGEAFVQLETRFDATQANAIQVISRRFGDNI